MKIVFRCEIEAKIPADDDFRSFPFVKILESENVEELLHAVAFTNGTETYTPTAEELLCHLFVDRAAYSGRNYCITVHAK